MMSQDDRYAYTAWMGMGQQYSSNTSGHDT